MVKRKNINKNIIDTVKRYSDKVRSKGVNVRQTILFGSYAKGDYQKQSDIDVCIVSDDFGRDGLRETQRLLSITHDVDERIEPVPFSPKDLDNKYSSLASEIRKNGVVVT